MAGLERSKLFSSLNDEEIGALGASCQERRFSAGEQIFREGDSGDGVYVVNEGLVQISALVSPTERRVLSRIKPGDFFGEMAVLDGEPRSGSAIAEQATLLCFIPREKLLDLIEKSPRLAVGLVREFSLRMRDFNRQYIQEVLQAERLTLVGRFARSIVHDFKNPLNIIGLAAELMNMEKVSPEMRATGSERIRKQVDRLNNMISELLEFTRAPHQDFVLGSFNFAQYITGVLADLQPELEDKGVKVVLRNAPPDVSVPLDPKRFLHVFTNLTHNAVDAMEGDGQIIFSFELKPGEVLTEIEDTGQGIPAEIVNRLFEPFATFGKAKGSGLGLSICKKIIEDHRGWIRARNEPGRGAIFTFGLPVSETAPSGSFRAVS
ncbi:MAG TPA: ATP-binding protein [Verrucomicrobiae bacterium]|nr:ATP-binding protein [Verrucomicrobiae bacterium]